MRRIQSHGRDLTPWRGYEMVKRTRPKGLSQKQQAIIRAAEERMKALPEALLQNALLEETGSYLTRGRRFENLEIGQLNEVWAKAIRQFVRQQVGPHVRDMDDAGAEIRLRGAELPLGLVTAELDQLRAAVLRIGPSASASELHQKIDEFIRNMNKPKN
jgi:hypothetical protein